MNRAQRSVMFQTKATPISVNCPTWLRGALDPTPPHGPGSRYVQQLGTYIQDRIVEEQSQGRDEVVVALLLHL